METIDNPHRSGSFRAPTMLWHGFPLPIMEEIVLILHFYDVCPMHLPPHIVLVQERAKLLHMTFSVRFDYEEIFSQIELN